MQLMMLVRIVTQIEINAYKYTSPGFVTKIMISIADIVNTEMLLTDI